MDARLVDNPIRGKPRSESAPSASAIEKFLSTPDEVDELRFSLNTPLSDGEVAAAALSSTASRQEEHETFVASGSREFHLRHTLSYWVSVAFATGSLMFIVGGLGGLYRLGPRDHREERSFVTVPYIVGGACYTLGCYAGFLAVINLMRKDPTPPGAAHHPVRLWAVMRTRRAWWAQLCYVVGAVLFNVETLARVAEVVGASAVMGSCLFVAGASLEVWHNDGFTHFRPRKLAFWTAWCDLAGSLLFLAGSLAMYAEDQDDAVDWCFVAGCVFFLASSLCGLWMWKLEQYGNTYLPELNLTGPSRDARGLVRVRGFQVFFVLVYAAILTLATSNISLAARCAPERVLSSVLGVLMPLGLLALGSALHTVPEGPPFSYLLWWFRAAMLYQLAVEALSAKSICRAYDKDHGDDDGGYR